MAGTGWLSRKGNTRALNGALGTGITGGSINPPGDQVGALSATLGTGVATTLACAASGGGAVLTKAIPDKACLVIVGAAGDVDSMELVAVNGGVAVGGVAVTFQSQTIRVSHAAGSLLFLVAHKHWLALISTTTAPTDNSLGSELVFSGYARQQLLWTAPTAADPPVAANQVLFTFGPMSGAPTGSAVVTYASDMDCSSAGAADNQNGWWTLASTRTPVGGDSITVGAAALSMQNFH
jgi:hypothetical protein